MSRTMRSLRSACNCATRRMLDVPTTAPAGSAASKTCSRLTSTSKGLARWGTQASDKPVVSAVGRSLRLCTAASIAPVKSARSNSRTKTPSLPMAEIGTSERTSPCVEMVTISTAWPSRRNASTMSCVCVRANVEARVPTRTIRDDSICSILSIVWPVSSLRR